MIFAYSRSQAIADSIPVYLTDLVPKETQRLYKYPVAYTANAWALIERACKIPAHGNETVGVVWDVMYMSVNYPVVIESESSHLIHGGGHFDAQYGDSLTRHIIFASLWDGATPASRW